MMSPPWCSLIRSIKTAVAATIVIIVIMKQAHASQEIDTVTTTRTTSFKMSPTVAVEETSLWTIQSSQQQRNVPPYPIQEQQQQQQQQNIRRMLLEGCNGTDTNVTTTNTTTSVVTRNDTFIASVLVAYKGKRIQSISDTDEEEIMIFEDLFSNDLVSSTPTRDVEEGNCIIDSVIVSSPDVTVLKTQHIPTQYDDDDDGDDDDNNDDLPPQLMDPVRRRRHHHRKQRLLETSPMQRNFVDIDKNAFLLSGGDDLDDEKQQYYDGLLLVDIVGRCVRSIKITVESPNSGGCDGVNETTADNTENTGGQNLDADLSRPCQCLIDIGNSIVNGGMAVQLNETIRRDDTVTFIDTIENIIVVDDLDCPVFVSSSSLSSSSSNMIQQRGNAFPQHRVHYVEVPFIIDDLILYEPTIKQTIDDMFTITYNHLSSLNIPSSTCFRSFLQKLVNSVQLISATSETVNQVANMTNTTVAYTTLEFAFDFYCARYWPNGNSNSNEECTILFEDSKESIGDNIDDIINDDDVDNNSMAQNQQQLLGLVASITDGVNSTTTDGDIERIRRCLCVRYPPGANSPSSMSVNEELFLELFTIQLEKILTENGFPIIHIISTAPLPSPSPTSNSTAAPSTSTNATTSPSQSPQPTSISPTNSSSDFPTIFPTNEDDTQ